MVKVKIDTFLKAEDLLGATSKTPLDAVIVTATLIPAAELPFQSDEDKWELVVQIQGVNFEWLPNKTSLREFVKAYGDESDNWTDKPIKLYSVEQNVGGKIKQVVYAIV